VEDAEELDKNTVELDDGDDDEGDGDETELDDGLSDEGDIDDEFDDVEMTV